MAPNPTRTADGDEIPVWCVYVGNERSRTPPHRVLVLVLRPAQDLAQRMARDRKLELVQDATPD